MAAADRFSTAVRVPAVQRRARACIGRHLAMLESTILVRALLRGFRLESLDATMPLYRSSRCDRTGAVRVRFHPRAPAGPVA